MNKGKEKKLCLRGCTASLIGPEGEKKMRELVLREKGGGGGGARIAWI
jgi:hypothetical protein